VVLLTAHGLPVPEQLLEDLAAAVLSQQAAALALAVRAGGPHQLDRALELAELVMRLDLGLETEAVG